ncbi:hypothetical protein [Pigmentiphaga sp. CHJ604]|uniref:hypothetical protein n=1 Tax=Pigmentiphaga sp. CHJ604 TaxID=3081984 RepID=UPI0030D1291C
MRIEDLYASAARAGLLAEVEFEGRRIAVDFLAPDESVLDGLALSTDYAMRYPASALPDLAAGHTVTLGAVGYRVREVRAVGDGSERHAALSRL